MKTFVQSKLALVLRPKSCDSPMFIVSHDGPFKEPGASNYAEDLLRQAQAISAEISSNPRNSEDNLWRPDKLRERLQILIDVYGLVSQGPPLAAHRREATEIRPIFDAAMSHYRHFLATSCKQNFKRDKEQGRLRALVIGYKGFARFG